MERFDLSVGRERTPSGGWEWFLLVGGTTRVQLNDEGTGIVTGDDNVEQLLPDVVCDLLAAAARRGV